MKHETFTSSGNAKSELEDYSRKIAAKPSLVGTIHRNDGGLVGNFAMLNQHDVVAGNAHFLSWAEQRREEREREVPNDFNAPTLPRSYIVHINIFLIVLLAPELSSTAAAASCR